MFRIIAAQHLWGTVNSRNVPDHYKVVRTSPAASSQVEKGHSGMNHSIICGAPPMVSVLESRQGTPCTKTPVTCPTVY